MNRLKNSINGLTVVKVLIFAFFGLFMLLPLLSVFVVGFTGEPTEMNFGWR
ncbi:hypothetical protein QTL97_04310 [Sporosarcina thermotolerans]|uniref:ABC transporter permease n=1 Tax=Sporosarcina thermotolerans TaxID=633404 RepID=A0AAW9A751_9BACL|nr:hypothetical protein [Sporosarcina thermotolerans]MDW0116145.1 hypothetical protein [Sporosarcina thermotolerans]WHT48117.1 hypothetical protein QNH10_19145 [Sporosarcina thermotolerans]